MLSHIDVRNFQSLADVSLELKPFTVIQGRSSSGKSALTRALKTLTSNQRGDSFISNGQTQCVITVKNDRGTVALLRGKKNEYILIDPNGEKQAYTKLEGKTPEDVSAFLGIPAKDPLNFADQFDMPYLLRSTAGDVARTLGELTNVSVIFDAAREANRRRLDNSRTLGLRTSDYADLTSDMDRYATLTDDLAKLEQAEEVLESVKKNQTRIDRLSVIIEVLENVPDVVPPLVLPSIDTHLLRAEQIARLDSLIQTITEGEGWYDTFATRIMDGEQTLYDLNRDYEDALRDLGTCPTCGQDTHDLTEHITVTG